jgi:small subunit ribosomal protein S20
MPHTRSAKRHLRKSEKQRLQNRAIKRDIKIQIKQVLDAAESGNADQLRKEYNLAAKRLDKAAAKQVIHRNMAARKKSQLARLMNQKSAPAAKSK